VLPGLARRALAETVGSAGLLAAVIGSGIAAQRLSPGDVGLQLLENSVATTLALVALILALGSVSGAHLNPLVSAVEWARGRQTAAETGTYVLAQVVGAVLGAVLAHAMFDLPLLEASTQVRTGTGQWLGEAVAACGLLLVLHGTLASDAKAVPLAVGAYIGAAYWFTSSTSFANPAVTVARSLSDTFAGIAPASVPGFLLAQVVGGLVAIPLLAALLPRWWR